MNKFELTKVELLQPGDRFYFALDKKQTVHEVIELKPKRFKYGHLTAVIHTPGIRNSGEHVKDGREVVFLRNVKQEANASDAV